MRGDPVSRFMYRRPLALAAACYAAGAAIGSSGKVPPALWGVLMTLTGVGFLLKRRLPALFCLVLLLGAWAAGAQNLVPPYEEREGVVLSGRVCRAPELDAARTIITLEDVRVDGERFAGLARVYAYGEVEADIGRKVRMLADTWRAQGQRNPGGFDFAAYLRRKGITLCATVGAETLAQERTGGFSVRAFTERLRERLSRQIEEMFPEESALAQSILLGDKRDMPEEMLRQFRDAGVSHLLAVSGLHVSCIALALFWLLRKLRLSRTVAYLVVAPLVWVYAGIVGFPASAVRAALMFMLAGGARALGRPYDLLTGLASALLCLLAINPLSIADPGLLLSFSAIAGILFLTPPLTRLCQARRWPRPVRRALELIAVSLGAQLGTLPAVCCLYGAITPYAPLTNLLAVPLSSLALPLLLGAVLAGMACPVLIPAVAWLPGLALKGLSLLTGWVSALPYATLCAPAWPWFLCVAYFALVFLCSPYVRVRERARLFLLPGLALLCALSFPLAWLRVPQGLAITILDAGQADAIVVSAERTAYLVDVGKEGGPADDYLRHAGRKVEAVFLTHPHADHAGGLMELMSIREIPVIYLPACWNEVEADEGIQEAVDEAVRRGSTVKYLTAGDRLALSDGVICEVLGPDAQAAPGRRNGNAASLVLRMVYGSGSAILTGDLTTGAEPRVPDCDLLKVAHHGSVGSTSEYLLRAATPSVAAISVGRNGYGHPAPALLERLARVGVAVFRTDQSGALTAHILSDGSIEMETFL